MNTVGKKLSIPYNNDYRGTLEIMKKYGEYIREVYFVINPGIIGSGRGGGPHDYYDEILRSLIAKAKELNIKSNLIVNPLGATEQFADRQKFTQILNYVDYFSNVLEIDYVTVTNPILAQRLSEISRVAKIVASVNMFIDSVEGVKKAMQLGIKEFYIDRESNWNLDLIRNIKQNFDIKVRVMLNEGCVPNCLFRISHFDCVGLMQNETAFTDLRTYEDKHRTLGCQASYARDLSLLLKTPVLRPEDLTHYDPYVDTFKVVGRTAPTAINEIRIKAYGERSYKGDFGVLIDNSVAKRVLDGRNLIIDNGSFPEDYFQRKLRCRKMCNACKYCATVIKQVLKSTEPAEKQN